MHQFSPHALDLVCKTRGSSKADEILALGEVAIQRRFAHPGCTCDVLGPT